VKRAREWTRNQIGQISGPAKTVCLGDGGEFLVFDLVVPGSPPATSAMARVTPFFNLDQGDLDSQVAVRKNPSKMDQVIEKVEHGTLFGAHPPPDNFALFGCLFDQNLANDDRFDHDDGVVLDQNADLVADGGKRDVLDFDKPVFGNHVDPVSAERHFEPRAVAPVKRFQCSMQRRFHEATPREVYSEGGSMPKSRIVKRLCKG